jgi:hypothetical protein
MKIKNELNDNKRKLTLNRCSLQAPKTTTVQKENKLSFFF